jgi:hypothetical protein
MEKYRVPFLSAEETQIHNYAIVEASSAEDALNIVRETIKEGKSVVAEYPCNWSYTNPGIDHSSCRVEVLELLGNVEKNYKLPVKKELSDYNVGALSPKHKNILEINIEVLDNEIIYFLEKFYGDLVADADYNDLWKMYSIKTLLSTLDDEAFDNGVINDNWKNFVKYCEQENADYVLLVTK